MIATAWLAELSTNFPETSPGEEVSFSVGQESTRRMLVVRKSHADKGQIKLDQKDNADAKNARIRSTVNAASTSRERSEASRRPTRGVYVPPGRARMLQAKKATAQHGLDKPPPAELHLSDDQCQEIAAKLGTSSVKFLKSSIEVIPGEELNLDCAESAQEELEQPSGGFEHNVLEAHDFPAEFATADLLQELKNIPKSDPFELRWVDDTHALLVFQSEAAANTALSTTVGDKVKLRKLEDGIEESKAKAESHMLVMMRNRAPRPETSTLVARRLLSGALGSSMKMSREMEQKEKQRIADAREQRKQSGEPEPRPARAYFYS